MTLDRRQILTTLTAIGFMAPAVRAEEPGFNLHLTNEGLIMPVTVAGQGLRGILDCGASATLMDAGIAEKLGLIAVSERLGQAVYGQITAGESAPVHIRAGDAAYTVPVMILPMKQAGLTSDMLIGRDILNHYPLDLDGPARRASFRRPRPAVGMRGLDLSRSPNGALVVDMELEGRPVRASLDTGTVAALAGGLDQPYPPENVPLLEEICEGRGLAISEMPFGWEPRARDFPRRNRLIAGISLGVAVVEAATRSGSLITARLAAEFGRLVFAVPGSPLDPRCQGTNGLLKDGAMIITSPQDVIEALAPLSQLDLFSAPVAEEPAGNGTDLAPPDDSDRARIADALGPTPVEIDDIIRHTGLPAPSVYLVLLELDIAGRLHRHPGGMVSLAMGD